MAEQRKTGKPRGQKKQSTVAQAATRSGFARTPIYGEVVAKYGYDPLHPAAHTRQEATAEEFEAATRR